MLVLCHNDDLLIPETPCAAGLWYENLTLGDLRGRWDVVVVVIEEH